MVQLYSSSEPCRAMFDRAVGCVMLALDVCVAQRKRDQQCETRLEVANENSAVSARDVLVAPYLATR